MFDLYSIKKAARRQYGLIYHMFIMGGENCQIPYVLVVGWVCLFHYCCNYICRHETEIYMYMLSNQWNKHKKMFLLLELFYNNQYSYTYIVFVMHGTNKQLIICGKIICWTLDIQTKFSSSKLWSILNTLEVVCNCPIAFKFVTGLNYQKLDTSNEAYVNN